MDHSVASPYPPSTKEEEVEEKNQEEAPKRIAITAHWGTIHPAFMNGEIQQQQQEEVLAPKRIITITDPTSTNDETQLTEKEDVAPQRITITGRCRGTLDYFSDHQRSFSKRSTSTSSCSHWILKMPHTLGAILLLVLSLSAIGEAAKSPEKICSTIVVQCDVASLRKLDNCTVIEGSLFILQMKSDTRPQDYD
ncbi:hypothetical protein EGW08_010269, partial [Elysia chlorotica]